MNTKIETRNQDAAFIQGLNNEDKLDLSKMPVDLTKAIQEIGMCTTHLSINQVMLSDSDKLICKIPIAAFTDLQLEAETLRENNNNKYVIALKMHLGVDSQNKITLFFQSVYCECLKPDPSIKKRIFTIVKEGVLKSYNGQNMIADSDNGGYRARYVKNIGVKHNDTETTPFQFETGKDTESIIFSFQEIVEFIKANPLIDEVFIYNSIRTDKSNVPFIYKHTLLLSPEIQALVRESFKGKFANLAHLCPPHCKDLPYDLL